MRPPEHASHALKTHRSLLRRIRYLLISCRVHRLLLSIPVTSDPDVLPMIEVPHRFAYLLFVFQRLGSRVLHPAIYVRARETPMHAWTYGRMLCIMASIKRKISSV